MTVKRKILRHEKHGDRVVRCFAERPAHLWEMFERVASASPAAEAVVDGALRLTYHDLEQRALAWSGTLARHGVGRQDRVAILLGNQADYIAALLAIWRHHAIAVPINVREGGPEIAHALERSGAVAIVTEGSLSELVPGVEAVAVLEAADLDLSNQRPPAPAEIGPEDDPAVILFTSGTTGKPKGAVLTHCNIIHSCLHYEVGLGLKAGERAALAVPASHVTGLVAIIAAMLMTGGCTVIMAGFKASHFLELVESESVTYTLMVPAMYALCTLEPGFARFSPGSWRVAGFGGAPMPSATLDAFRQLVPDLAFSNVYGATETSSPSTIMPADRTAERLASVGLPVVCGSAVIMDEQGQEVAAGQRGEVWLGGPQVSPGYWQDQEATVREFVGGFWKSGDLGSKDADGFLYIHDRIKDLVNRGGYKVYSAEVENVLLAHPAVAEAAILGVPCPVLGERIRAVVSLKEGATFDLEMAREHVGKALADYKRPDFLTIWLGALPRNANGKVLKREIKALVRDAR